MGFRFVSPFLCVAITDSICVARRLPPNGHLLAGCWSCSAVRARIRTLFHRRSGGSCNLSARARARAHPQAPPSCCESYVTARERMGVALRKFFWQDATCVHSHGCRRRVAMLTPHMHAAMMPGRSDKLSSISISRRCCPSPACATRLKLERAPAYRRTTKRRVAGD